MKARAENSFSIQENTTTFDHVGSGLMNSLNAERRPSRDRLEDLILFTLADKKLARDVNISKGREPSVQEKTGINRP